MKTTEVGLKQQRAINRQLTAGMNLTTRIMRDRRKRKDTRGCHKVALRREEW